MSRVAMTLAWLWHSTSSSAKYALPTFLQDGNSGEERGSSQACTLHSSACPQRSAQERGAGGALYNSQPAEQLSGCTELQEFSPVRQDVCQRDAERHLK